MSRYTGALGALLAIAALAACQPPTAPQQTGEALGAARQIAVGAAPHGIAAAAGFIYNADTGAGRFSVIDAATDAVVATIETPDGKPGYLKPFHDEKHMLALDTQKGELLVIDPAQAHAVVQRLAIGRGPDKIAIGEDDRTVLVSLVGEPKVVKLKFGADRAQPPEREDLAVGGVAVPEGGHAGHRAIAFEHGWAVTPSSADNNCHLLNLATGETKVVSDGNAPGPVAIGSLGELAISAIVGNAASNTVTVFALPTGAKTTLSDVGTTPTDIAVFAPEHRAFVTMAGSNELAVIDYASKNVVGRVPVGKRPVHVYVAPAAAARAVAHSGAPIAYDVFVGNDDGASVTVIDGPSLRVKATVATGKGHHKMAFSGTKAYVSNIADATISVIDRTQIR